MTIRILPYASWEVKKSVVKSMLNDKNGRNFGNYYKFPYLYTDNVNYL